MALELVFEHSAVTQGAVDRAKAAVTGRDKEPVMAKAATKVVGMEHFMVVFRSSARGGLRCYRVVLTCIQSVMKSSQKVDWIVAMKRSSRVVWRIERAVSVVLRGVRDLLLWRTRRSLSE